MDTNMIRICHGSENIIEKPEFGKGKTTNDYGRGFYCTESIELAKEWACSRANDGYANIYELDMNGLDILRLNNPPYHVLNWLAVLADNRTYWERSTISEEAKGYLRNHFLVDISPYDIIIGYRADDSYFTFAKNFVANGITLGQLQEAMKLGRLGEQIVLKSRRAFERLRFVEYESAPSEIYFKKKLERDQSARAEYRKRVRHMPNKDELLMIDIMREEMENGDLRLL